MHSDSGSYTFDLMLVASSQFCVFVWYVQYFSLSLSGQELDRISCLIVC